MYLAVLSLSCGTQDLFSFFFLMQCVDFSCGDVGFGSSTKNWTQAPCITIVVS